MASVLRRWFYNLSLNGKLVLIFSIPACFLAAVSVLTFLAFRDFEQANALDKRSYQIKGQAISYLEFLFSMQNAFRGYVMTGDRSFHTLYNESKGDIDLASLDLAGLVKDSPAQSQRDLVEDVQTMTRRLIKENDDIIASVESGARDKGVAYIKSGRGQDVAGVISSLLGLFEAAAVQIQNERRAAVNAKRFVVLRVIVGGALLTLILTGLGIIVVARSVTKPMSSLVKAAADIGELGHAAFPDADRQDEVGVLSRSMDEMQRRLATAERLATLTRVATSIAHDLRTPLVGIERGLQGLQYASDSRLNPDAQRLLGDLHAGARLAVGIVQDILDLYRQAYGELPLAYSRFVLGDVVREAADLMRSEVMDRRLSVSVEAPPVEIWADQRRLLRVMVNLLDNAVKNSPAGGGIWITVSVQGEASDRRAVVVVEDEGGGLDPAALETLFEPNRPASTPTRGGTGLGLYLCNIIIGAHKGAITAQNRPAGGARFAFDIPAEVHCVDQTPDRGRPAPV